MEDINFNKAMVFIKHHLYMTQVDDWSFIVAMCNLLQIHRFIDLAALQDTQNPAKGMSYFYINKCLQIKHVNIWDMGCPLSS
jgi:hypothetical protein